MFNCKSIRNAGLALGALIGSVALSSTAAATEAFVDTLGPRAERTFDMIIGDWQSRSVLLVGAGYTDLDLYVDDENGTRVCSAVGLTDVESCIITAIGDGQIAKVTVKNLGAVSNNFLITFE
jgi:hypothetical protein